jgi:conjugal transfer pilus assembly protein TraV
MKTRLIISMVFVPVLAVLAGCASSLNPGDTSEFACPGMPQGVVCKTPREVYKMTNKDFNDIGTAGDNDTVKKPQNMANAGPVLSYQPNMAAGSDLAPVPMVEPVKVLRIWVAPWVDKNKDLHWPGLVFTKVQKNQWNVGEESFDGVEPPVPFQIIHKNAPKPVDTKPGGTTGGAGGAVPSIPGMPSDEVNLN